MYVYMIRYDLFTDIHSYLSYKKKKKKMTLKPKGTFIFSRFRLPNGPVTQAPINFNTITAISGLAFEAM